MTGGKYRFQRVLTALAKATGMAICEPKLRLGRRRHDGRCDRCEEPLEMYAAEKLDFPLDDFDPDASTSTEKLQAMWNAQYVCVCLKCSADPNTTQERGGCDV
jgi:hypothetical protein